MTREERRFYGQSLVEEQRSSGQSASAFCHDRQLKISQFYRWRRKFHNESAKGIGGGFLELVSPSTYSPSGVRMHINREISIELDRTFDPLTLRNAIETLCTKPPCLA